MPERKTDQRIFILTKLNQGWTQDMLSDRLGITQQAVSDIKLRMIKRFDKPLKNITVEDIESLD